MPEVLPARPVRFRAPGGEVVDGWATFWNPVLRWLGVEWLAGPGVRQVGTIELADLVSGEEFLALDLGAGMA